jgi:hypothetical protein
MNQLRPLTVGELLDSAVRTYRERFRTLVAAVAVPMVPVVVLQTLISWSVEPESTDPFSAPDNAATISASEAALQLAGSLAGLVAILVGTALATAACFRALSSAYVGGEVSWRESLAFARTRVWSVIGLTLLSALGMLVGFLLCIAPGVLLYAWWAVATPALLMEGLGATDALRRSSALARQRFWPVLGAMLLSALLALVFQAALSAPLFGLLFTEVDGIVFYAVQGVVNLAVLILVTPFTASFTLALYVDLRVRLEGFDLYLWASNGGRATPGHVVAPGYEAASPYGSPTAPYGADGTRPTSGFGPPPSSLPPPPPPAGFGPPTSSLPPPPTAPPSPPDDHGP